MIERIVVYDCVPISHFVFMKESHGIHNTLLPLISPVTTSRTASYSFPTFCLFVRSHGTHRTLRHHFSPPPPAVMDDEDNKVEEKEKEIEKEVMMLNALPPTPSPPLPSPPPPLSAASETSPPLRCLRDFPLPPCPRLPTHFLCVPSLDPS